MDTLAEAVYRTIRRENLLPPGEEFAVGFSGGMDSSVLLHLLVTVRDEAHTGWRIRALHFNHGLRPEADEEEEFCRNAAASLGVAFTAGRADVRAKARGEGLCLEEAARACRYAFFRSSGLLTVLAHHREDQVETVLFNAARGTGIRGLAVMRRRAVVHGVAVVRPLLEVGKEEIRAYAARHAIRFVDDPSNRDTSFSRNLIRHEVVPLLERVHPGACGNLLRLSAWAREVCSYLEGAVSRLRRDAARAAGEGEEAYDAEVLRRSPRVERKMLFLETLERLGGHAAAAVLEAVEGLLAAGGGTRCIEAGGGVRVCRRYDLLVFSRRCGEAVSAVPPVPVRIPGRTEVPALGVVLESEVREFTGDIFAAARRNPDPWTAYLDVRVFDAREVVLRTRRAGDRFHPLGAPGTRKLQDFFTDARVPRCRRGTVPILESGGEIVWLVGMRIAEQAKLTPGTKRVVTMRARSTAKDAAAAGEEGKK